MVIPSLQRFGGAERVVVNLAENIDRTRFDLLLCCLYPAPDPAIEAELRKYSIKTVYLRKRRGPDLRVLIKLCQLFLRYRPQVVHTHQYILRYTLLPTVLARVPARIHTIHSLANKDARHLVTRLVNCLAFRVLSVVPVSVAQCVSDTVNDLYQVRSPVVYNGINIEAGLSNVKQSQQSSNKIVFLYAGRFVREKNLLMLLSAFAKAVSIREDLHLLLVGDGPEKLPIERFIHQNKLDCTVSLQKPVGHSEMLKIIEQVDVTVLASDYEGLPMVVLESMALRKPVIATSVGGVPEVVENGATGILVPPGDKKAMCDAMLSLAGDPTLRKSMGERGFQVFQQNFRASMMAQKYQALYLRLLEDATRRKT